MHVTLQHWPHLCTFAWWHDRWADNDNLYPVFLRFDNACFSKNNGFLGSAEGVIRYYDTTILTILTLKGPSPRAWHVFFFFVVGMTQCIGLWYASASAITAMLISAYNTAKYTFRYTLYTYIYIP